MPKSGFFSASESCLQTGDIRGISAAILPIPLGLGWDLSGTYLWDCEKVASLVLQQPDLQRLMSDAVPGGTISSDPKEWCQKLWCVSLKLNALCGISNVQWGNSFPLSLSQSLSLPVLFLIASKTWQGSACSCFPKWMGSQLLACAFLSSGIGCSNTLFIGLWDYPISYKIQQKQQQLCVCVSVFSLLPSSGRSTPALKCLHCLSVKYRTDLKTLLSSRVWDTE